MKNNTTNSLRYFDAQKDTLARHGVLHKHILGTSTDLLLYGWNHEKGAFTKRLLYIEDSLEPEELAFVKKVKSYAEAVGIPQIEVGKVNYHKYGKIPDRSTFKNCVQMDLNRAYWKFAFKEGFISQEIFSEGLEVDKSIRLIAFGAIAGVKHEYTFDALNNRYVYTAKIVNEKTRSYFFHVSSEIDKIMMELFKTSNHCLFYWVDALFLKNFTDYHQELNSEIKNRVGGFGLDMSVDDVEYISRYGKLVEVKMQLGKLKKFYISGKEVKKKQKPVQFKYR